MSTLGEGDDAGAAAASPPRVRMFRLRSDDYEACRTRDDLTLRAGFSERPVDVPRSPSDPDVIEASYSWRGSCVVEIRNGVVVRDSLAVFLSEGHVVRESVVRRSLAQEHIDDDAATLRTLEDAVTGPAEPTLVLATQRMENYSHWLLDVLSRVWLADMVLGPTTRLLMTPLETAFQRESLDLLDVTDRLVPFEEDAVRLPRLVFAPGLALLSGPAVSPYSNHYAQWLRRRMKLNRPAASRRIYLRRRDAPKRRRITNEDAVCDAVAAIGFEPVELSGLSFRAQADLFNGADTVVGPHGAGLVNQLFSPLGADIVEIFPHDGVHDSVYRRLASALGHRYRWVRGRPSGNIARNPNDSDLEIDIDELARTLGALARP